MAFWKKKDKVPRKSSTESRSQAVIPRSGIPDFAADLVMEHMRQMEAKRDPLYASQDFTSADYGLDPSNPICVYSIDSAAQYISMLRDPAGYAFESKRLGSVVMKDVHGVQDVPVDEYELYPNGSSPIQSVYKIFICPYGRDTFVAPKGLKVIKPEELPTAEQICRAAVPKLFSRFKGEMNSSGNYIFHLPTKDGANKIIVSSEEITKMTKAVMKGNRVEREISTLPSDLVISLAENTLAVEFCTFHFEDILWKSESQYIKARRDLDVSQRPEWDDQLKSEAENAGMSPAQFKKLSELKFQNFIITNLKLFTEANDIDETGMSDGAIFCKRCGAKIPGQSNFCNKCGAPIAKE